jgi:hypothetical protein
VTAQASTSTGAGIATAVTGQVTVSPAVASAPQRLNFKDEVHYRDRIRTASSSLARLLLGKKALLTVRELSELQLIDRAGTSTVELASGKISMGVARQRMGPDEVVEIRTQNAVAAVRGTVVIAEALTPPGARIPITRLHVLSGYIDVTTPGNPGAAPLRLVAPASVTVTGNTIGPAETLDAATRTALLSDLRPPQAPPTRVLEALVPGEQARAAGLARILAGQSVDEDLLDAQIPKLDLRERITPPTAGTMLAQGGGGGGQAPFSLPFIFNNQSANITGDLYAVQSVTSQDITTDFLEATGSTVTVGGSVLNVSGAMSTTSAKPFMSLKNSTLVAPDVAFLQNGTLSLPTTLLDAVNSTVTGDLGFVRSNAQLNLGGSFLHAVGSTISAPDHLLKLSTGGRVTATGLGALFDFSGTAVNVGTGSRGQYVQLIGNSNLTLAGPLLAADASTLAFTGSELLHVGGRSTLTSATSQSLWSLNGSSLSLDPGSKGFVTQAGATVSLNGGLLSATNSTITSSADFVVGSGRGQVVVTGPAPLVLVTGGAHQIATNGAIFHLSGTATGHDNVSGLTVGTEEPIQTSGSLLDLNAATVRTGRAVQVDVALLDASAPLLNLFGAGGAQLDTNGHAIDLTSQAKVTNSAAFVALDGSRMTVNNGAVVNVANGSYLKAGGSLVRLSNASTLNINNGVVLLVSGGSVVNISGALIAFNGTGLNRVNIFNTLPFVNIGGIPVALTDGALAANVIITGNAIKNPSLGRITNNMALVQVSGPTSKLTINGN